MSGQPGASRAPRKLKFDRFSDYDVEKTKGGKEEIKENAAKKEGGEEGIKEDAAKNEGAQAALQGYKAKRAVRSDVPRDWVKKKATSSSGSDEPLKSSDLEPDEGIYEDYEKLIASKPAKLKALTSKQGDREAGAK